MDFPSPLIPGTLARRYKRFFADVLLEGGGAVTAHCPNPGSMLGLATPGARVWLSKSDSPTRKLAHTLELVEADGTLVGVNTMLPNRLVDEALRAGAIPELAGYDVIRREVPYGTASRVDFVLEHPARTACYLEVKSVTLSRQAGLAEFPDSISARATGHLDELTAIVRDGRRAVVLFLVQRMDCGSFAPAGDIDARFDTALTRAMSSGIEVLCYACDINPGGVSVSKAIEWRRRCPNPGN